MAFSFYQDQLRTGRNSQEFFSLQMTSGITFLLITVLIHSNYLFYHCDLYNYTLLTWQRYFSVTLAFILNIGNISKVITSNFSSESSIFCQLHVSFFGRWGCFLVSVIIFQVFSRIWLRAQVFVFTNIIVLGLTLLISL